MSSPDQDQGSPGRDVPPPGQPMQQAPASWPQQGHQGQPPVYGAAPPPYGAAAPAYGTAAPVGYRGGQRPGAVTAAAVMAFVVGAVVILINVFALFFFIPSVHDAFNTWARVVGLVRLALGAVFIWGGIAALKGRTRTVLLVVSVIEAIFSLLLLMFLVLSVWFWFLVPPAAMEFTFVVTILILILQPQSRDFFGARRETAN